MNKCYTKFNSYFNSYRSWHWSITLLTWIFVAMSVIYIMIPPISISNSLYYPSDTSVFFMMGEYWQEGMQPGRDLFDHKGPLLYVIYAVGTWLIPGKAGLFLLLSLSLGISFYFMFRIARLFLSRYEAVLVMLAYLAICSSVFMGGSEDFSLPFVVGPLYYLIRHIHLSQRMANIPEWVWIFSGISFGAIIMLRPNNAGVLCAIIIFVGGKMLLERQFFPLIKAAFLFLTSTILSFLPIVFLLHLNGSLADCIYAGYSFNLVFASKGVSAKSFSDWLVILKYSASLWLVLPFGYILRKKKILNKQVYAAMLTVSAISALFLIPGKNFGHYFILYSPCVVFALICLTLTIRNAASKKSIILAGLAFLSVYGSSIVYSLIILRYGFYGAVIPENHRKHQAELKAYQDSLNMRKLIPDSELNQVLHYNGQGNIYLYMHAKPPTKYFMLQEFLCRQVPAIQKTIESDIVQSKPTWIIIEAHQLASSVNSSFVHFIRNEYEPVKFQEESSKYLLFRRNTQK